jgi:hypothetical protein
MKLSVIYLVVFVACFNMGCIQSRQSKQVKAVITTTLVLKNLKRNLVDSSSLINISLLQIFPTYHECNGDHRFVNLYICKNDNSKDTLLVFEPCQQVPDYLSNNSAEKRPLCIATDDIQKKYLDSVFVDLPHGTKIPPGYKFVFAKILPLEE